MYRHPSLQTAHRENPLPLGISLGLVASERMLSFLVAPVLAGWRYYRQQRTIRMLRELDDQVLKDIGVNRSEIPSIVMGLPGRRRR